MARSRWMGQSLATAVVVAVFALALLSTRGQAASADEAAQASAASTVTIAHFEFQPPTLAISRGSKVRFSNASGTAHTATRKGSFNTGRIKPGKSAAVIFNRKGTFSYHCSIHPFMKGKIVVD